MTSWLRKLKTISAVPQQIRDVAKLIDEQKILFGKMLIQAMNYSLDLPISEYEFSVFSQWGDDGIIQYLIRRVDVPNQTFIEFGTENYTESNTRFLLQNNNWSGLIIESSKKQVEEIQRSDLYWKFDLTALNAFITKENIDELIFSRGFSKDVGLLSIDIDGNDYWIWKAISTITPIIIIVEYNSVFGPHKSWTVPYSPEFMRTVEHSSNLYFGASLLTLCDLAESKGYYFVGCSSSGNNAYFVRKDKIGPLRPLKAEEGYVESKFRESRNTEGQLSYLTGEARLQTLKGMKIFNTRTSELETIE